MYDLTQDAIKNKPKLYCKHGLRELYSLEESREIIKQYFTDYYDFNTKLKEYLSNVTKCKSIFDLEKYVCYGLVKGFDIKSKINLSKIYKNKK